MDLQNVLHPQEDSLIRNKLVDHIPIQNYHIELFFQQIPTHHLI